MKIIGINPQERDIGRIAEALHRLLGNYTVLPSYPAATLGDAAAGINTTGKRVAKAVWDETNGLPLWAAGAGATDPWNDATGSASITPS